MRTTGLPGFAVSSPAGSFALYNAVARRSADNGRGGGAGDLAGCVARSDRGIQFRSRKFLNAPNRHHLDGSMGRVRAAGDNAARESFSSLLLKNVLDSRSWNNRKRALDRHLPVNREDLTLPPPRRTRPIEPHRVRDHHAHHPLRQRDPTCHLSVQHSHDYLQRRMAWVEGRLDERHEGWETPQVTAHRFAAAVADHAVPGTPLVVASHGMAITAWLAHSRRAVARSRRSILESAGFP